MTFEVLETGENKPSPPINIRGHHHKCYVPGRIVRWLRGIHTGGIIQCMTIIQSSQDSVEPNVKYDKYTPICGRKWKWTGLDWVIYAGY
jgi:hypothetical protein